MPGRIDRAKHFIVRKQWARDSTGLTRTQKAAQITLRTVTFAVHEFIENRCVLRAAALTLVFIFSLAPALALGFSVAKGFGAQKQVEPWIYSQLGLDEDGEDNKVRDIVDHILAYVEKTDVKALGVVGLAIVMYAAYKVLASVEKTMNDIWRVRRRRSLLRKTVDYVATLFVLPLMLMFTSLILAGLRSEAGSSALGAFMPPLLLKFLGVLATLAFATGGLWFLYYFFPNTKVPPLSAFAGAVVAAVLWALLQYFYMRLQVGVAKYNAVYGTFAAVPIFLLWLNFSWLVILFGAELSYAHAMHPELEYAGLRFTPSAAYRERVALGVMAVAAPGVPRGAGAAVQRGTSRANWPRRCRSSAASSPTCRKRACSSRRAAATCRATAPPRRSTRSRWSESSAPRTSMAKSTPARSRRSSGSASPTRSRRARKPRRRS